jgi:serine/threonine-protein kinase
VSDTLAAVLDKEPDWRALGNRVPDAARRLLQRSLTKDVRHRLQHIGDARLELEETKVEAGQRPALDHPTFRAVPALLIAAVLIATSAGIAFWVAGRARTIGERAVTRLTLKLDDKTNGDLTLPLQGWDRPFAISPDGRRIVLRARGGGRSQLFLRELSGFETRPIPGTEAARTPFFSPDGQWIGFWRAEDRTLWKVSVAGGSPIELAPTDVPPIAIWGTDDEIVIQSDYPKGELWAIPAAGGQPKRITVTDRSNGESISLRGRVPGGNDLLVAGYGLSETWLDVLSRETGKRRHIVRGGNTPASYTPTGHFVYSDADALLAVPVNQRLEPVGKPVPVLSGVDHLFRHANVALSDNGTLIYVPADSVEESQLVWKDREGGVTPIPGGRGPIGSAALSPDGREAAVILVEGTKLQVWVLDLERGARRLLVRNVDVDQPLWSRDGKFVTYVGIRGDERAIYRTRRRNRRRGISRVSHKMDAATRLVSGRTDASV